MLKHLIVWRVSVVVHYVSSSGFLLLVIDFLITLVIIDGMSDLNEQKIELQRAIEIAGSQAKLAKLANRSQAAISKIYSGESKMTAETAQMIERGLDGKVCKIKLLFGTAA